MKPINILLIEDNEGDILLTHEAFEESRIINKINTIRDGEAAVRFFERAGKEDEMPQLILLDINLPKKSGHDVLNYIKNSEKYKCIPVIMLTTSSSENDISKSYRSHANCYITKPIDALDFARTVSKIGDFWANIASMPAK
jgi:CheY-like chemotaxis protein